MEQQASSSEYDAVILVSFGGPEGPDDVLPFLENVTRGRDVPRERLEEVAAQYDRFGGASPINAQNRALIAALEKELVVHGFRLPVYFGNRNWQPLLEDTVERMKRDGVRAALAFVTSAYSSYSGCRQYRDDIAKACVEAGAGAPRIDKLQPYWNHPGFIEPMAANLRDALASLPPAERAGARVVFTAHSLPQSMAATCDYEAQLEDAARLIAERADVTLWDRVYQSRSGPPTQPWLEPDIVDHLDALHARGIRSVVLVPSGFISDHMEVVYDLDTRARQRADDLGLNLVRVPTVGTAPRFVSMIRELIEERTIPGTPRQALGPLGPRGDVCAPDCCPAPRRPPNAVTQND
jgi:ferrochelatase